MSKYRKWKKVRFVPFMRLRKKWTHRNSVSQLYCGDICCLLGFWDFCKWLGGMGRPKNSFVSGGFSPLLAIFRQRLVLLVADKEGSPPHAIYHSPPDCPWGAEDITCAKGVSNLLGDEGRQGVMRQSQGTMCSRGSGSCAGIHSHPALGTE